MIDDTKLIYYLAGLQLSAAYIVRRLTMGWAVINEEDAKALLKDITMLGWYVEQAAKVVKDKDD